jgi:hypothetical protein
MSDYNYWDVAQDAVDKTLENNGNIWETAKDLNEEYRD